MSKSGNNNNNSRMNEFLTSETKIGENGEKI